MSSLSLEVLKQRLLVLGLCPALSPFLLTYRIPKTCLRHSALWDPVPAPPPPPPVSYWVFVRNTDGEQVCPGRRVWAIGRRAWGGRPAVVGTRACVCRRTGPGAVRGREGPERDAPSPQRPGPPPAPLGEGGFAGPRLVLGARAQMWQGGACDLVVRILAPATGRRFLRVGHQDPVFSGGCEPRGSHTQSAPWLRMWEHSRVSKVPVRASGCGAPGLARLDSDSPANPHRPPSLAAHSHPRGLRRGRSPDLHTWGWPT